MIMSRPAELDHDLQKSSSVSCSETNIEHSTSPSHISISTKTEPTPISILSGTSKGPGSLTDNSQISAKAPSVILTTTSPSVPSSKTKFVQQTSPRVGPTSPSEPPSGLFLKDLSLSNKDTILKPLKGWKTDRRKATPYPQPEAEEYEFDDTPEDVSTEDAEDDQ